MPYPYDEEEEVDPWAPPTNGVAPNAIALPPAAPPLDTSMMASPRPPYDMPPREPPTTGGYDPSLRLSAPGQPDLPGQETLTPEYKPGSTSLYDAHRMAASQKGIKNRLLRGLDMARVDFLEDPNSPGSPNLKYAAGRAVGDMLMGLISPGSAGRAYEQKVMRPRQEQEKEIARRDQAETWQLQDRENRLKLQGLDIDTKKAAAEAANWADMGITVGKDGRKYHVIRHSITGDEKWLLQPADKPVFRGKDQVQQVQDAQGNWIDAPGAAKATTKAPVLYSAEEAAKGASTELGGDVGKAQMIADTKRGRPDAFRKRVNEIAQNAQFKNDKGDVLDAHDYYKWLETTNPTKYAKLGAAAKLAQAQKDIDAQAESDVESNYKQRLDKLTPKYKNWQKDMPIPDFGLESYGEEVPDAMRGIPRGAAPPATAPATPPAGQATGGAASGSLYPAGVQPRPNPNAANRGQNFNADHAAWKVRMAELTGLPQDVKDKILAAEGW